ncbi:MAG TPA: enoyl-CoA hydratase-related protein [Gemmatimonadales bacterium]|jgi:2-(1,2-epoxy-1,2-dihydrophenyl)acetyl-CoA isomerase|nr:enoyl-CoA hydratase-related protein [Gemmatimonadales bacterium]
MTLVLTAVSDGVATLTLNRPEKLNALTLPLCDELIAALRTASQDAGIRAIVITGAGRAFCAGADLTVLGSEGNALVTAGRQIALLVRTAPQPVLAAVNGAAAGGGANLALACDYRVAAETAAIGQVFARLGLGPDWGGSYFLPRLVGTSRALELLWSARMVPAAEAHDLGLFDRLVPADRLETEVRALALAWASFPSLALRRAKEAIYRSLEATLPEMLDLEVAMQRELFATDEARARLESFATRSR